MLIAEVAGDDPTLLRQRRRLVALIAEHRFPGLILDSVSISVILSNRFTTAANRRSKERVSIVFLFFFSSVTVRKAKERKGRREERRRT